MSKYLFSIIIISFGLASPAMGKEQPSAFWKAMSAIKQVVKPDANNFDADVWSRNRYLNERGIAVTNRNLTDLTFPASDSAEIQIGRDGVKFLQRF